MSDEEIVMTIVASENETMINKSVDNFFKDKSFTDKEKLLISMSIFVYLKRIAKNIEKIVKKIDKKEEKKFRETSLNLH